MIQYSEFFKEYEMRKKEAEWVRKWRELERLVDKKYEGYISIVGLSIEQFNEATLRYFKVYLTIRKYSFCIGNGRPRVAAIKQAIKVIRSNQELERYVPASEPVHVPIDNIKIFEEVDIIKECAFPGVKPPRRRLPAPIAGPLTKEEKRMLDKVLPK